MQIILSHIKDGAIIKRGSTQQSHSLREETNMEITTTQFKRCDLVKASGRINSQTAPQLAEAFKAIEDENRYRLVFDMSQVDFISSAGLRVMIDVQKTCKQENRGEMVLAQVPERVYETLDLAGFVDLFRIYDQVVEAVGSF
jgi:anti-sigma B factor antagonist